MFSKSRQTPANASSAVSPQARAAAGGSFSVLGADVTVTGNISAGVDLHLDGRVDGDVSCASLVQGAGSVIRGAVTADSARLAGTVDGSINAKELVIQASARITGDVTYEKLTIEPGGQVDGRFTHRANAAPKVELVASN
ncbi:polymer-forming cytoskeletal protein [Sandaracinobacter neustonicus]|uniref:Polymer-forming cytoskeletal protein n=1 Tax=Sandaracinobacter neustonicus TaxID=1715348 RepID=A0A501XLE4_9SPHN|nr:polymer-forming cytoskeletal protein [Sandaracinobacter neustonicus]TPE61390.1 polymer-forming cytoskeletal protein [Sandaracinobacter neustonicus]